MARSKLATAASRTKRLLKKPAATSGRTAKKASAKSTGRKTAAKHIGDVLGVSTARVPKSVPRATTARGGRPKGIEIGPQAKGTALLKRARARH
jgi:hypothetical protein